MSTQERTMECSECSETEHEIIVHDREDSYGQQYSKVMAVICTDCGKKTGV